MKKETVKTIGKVDTIIGGNSEIKGTIASKSTIRIDGKLEGGISNAEGVIVGEHGEVNGNINAQSVMVSGKIEGNVSCSNTLEILPEAQIYGDIQTPVLTISEGAIFEGNCTMAKEKNKIIEPEFKQKLKEKLDRQN